MRLKHSRWVDNPEYRDPEEQKEFKEKAAELSEPIAQEVWGVLASHQENPFVPGAVSGINALACVMALQRCAIPLLSQFTDRFGWNELVDWFCDTTRKGLEEHMKEITADERLGNG